jgi:hypothetical protein
MKTKLTGNNQKYCKPCSKIVIKLQDHERYIKNPPRSPEKIKKMGEQTKRSDKEARMTVLSHYSDGMLKCNCCDESHYEFLALDHINGNGGKHRKELNKTGGAYYRWIIKNNYPDGFRVLCHNCNMAHGLYGFCPHEKEQINV